MIAFFLPFRSGLNLLADRGHNVSSTARRTAGIKAVHCTESYHSHTLKSGRKIAVGVFLGNTAKEILAMKLKLAKKHQAEVLTDGVK
jgi:hypothetical protein